MTGRQRDLLVIIPAWNEQETVGPTVREAIAALPQADVLVVDDGSTDATAAEATAAGCRVLRLAVNLGVGGAMRAGYLYARESGYRRAVQLDADGQHDPAEVLTLLRTLDDEGADLVVGSRFAGVGDYTARGPRDWAIRVLSTALSRVTRTRLTDTTSGFKASGERAISLFSVEYPAEYLGDTVEALVIAARHHLRIAETGVRMRPRAGGRPSHGPLRSTVFLARATLALLMALSRPAPDTVQGAQ